MHICSTEWMRICHRNSWIELWVKRKGSGEKQEKCECMYACMHVCVYVCMYVYIHMSQIFMDRALGEAQRFRRETGKMWVYVCMYVCVFVCMYTCLGDAQSPMYVCVYVCIYTCLETHGSSFGWSAKVQARNVSVCMHVCMCVYVCAYTHVLELPASARIHTYKHTYIQAYTGNSVPR